MKKLFVHLLVINVFCITTKLNKFTDQSEFVHALDQYANIIILMRNEGDYLHGMLGSTENSHIKYKRKSLPSSTRQAPDNKLAAKYKTNNSAVIQL
jgi:hypothetical protein